MPSILRRCAIGLAATFATTFAIALASTFVSTVVATSAAAQAAPPDVDIFLVPLSRGTDGLRVGAPRNITRRTGYDNQPSFLPDARAVLYTSNRGDGQTDIYRYDLSTGMSVPMFKTVPESEYSAFQGRGATTVIRVEADSTQRLWQFPTTGGAPRVLFPAIKPVGYFAQADDSTWALFVLGSPATLQLARQGRDSGDVIARNIGRSLHRIPGSNRVSFVQKGPNGSYVMSLDPRTGRVDTLVRTLDASEDIAWADSVTLVSGKGSALFVWRQGDAAWTPLGDFASAGITNITRLAVSPNNAWLAVVGVQRP
ncbi:MAG TPA: hypothetical protein VE869_07760 [Gemmatimonas sp.]|nr:hypothetical protein [Gemmatimonas sp.]